jgi:hypothetical protein
MRRNASPILVVLLALCCAVAMLHVSIALGSSHQFGDSPRTTQTVRSYYASVNSFLAGGDLDQLVAGRTSESDLDDIPDVGRHSRDLSVSASRARRYRELR